MGAALIEPSGYTDRARGISQAARHVHHGLLEDQKASRSPGPGKNNVRVAHGVGGKVHGVGGQGQFQQAL